MAKKKNKQHHMQAPASLSQASREAEADPPAKLKRKEYEGEMRRLHGELVAMQEWVKATGAKSASCSRAGTPPGRGHDQADHRAGEPARVPGRCPARARP